MTHDPWQSVTPDEEPSQPALAGVDLMPKQGGYSLQEILQLHDTAQSGSAADSPETVSLPTVGSVAGPEAATVNPFAAFSLPTPAAPAAADAPKPARRGGLPMIDPSEFASAPIDRIEPVQTPDGPEALSESVSELPADFLGEADLLAETGMLSEADSVDSPDLLAETGIAPNSAVQLHALQQSLAALDELEAQLSMLAPDSTALTAEATAEPEAAEWVDALATTAPAPVPAPFPNEITAKPLIGPTTADDVVDDADDETLPFSPTPIERLEPAVQFPFPGMGTYGEEPAASITEPLPAAPSPVLVPAPAATAATAGDPPFFFHLDGESVDLATDLGIAACEEAARSAIADAGRTVQTMLEGQQRQRRMQELMSRVHAGGLSVDEVISLGQELQRLKDEIGTARVDRRAISELVARLEQQRALMGRLIDLLWRT